MKYSLFDKEKAGQKSLVFFIAISLLFFIALPLISASEDLGFKRGEVFDLKIPCEDEGYYCSSNTECNLTFVTPNGTALVDNQKMTYKISYFNYTIQPENTEEDTGNYRYTVMCADYSSGINGTDTGIILITARGKESTVADAIIYIGALVLLILFFVLCLYEFKKTNEPHYKLLSLYGVYLLLVAISYIVWLTSENMLMTTEFLSSVFYWMFIILMYGFIPVFFAGIIWLVWLAITVEPLKRMMEHGLPDEEISIRVSKNKGRRKRY